MLEIEVVVTIRDAGGPGGNYYIQVNESTEHTTDSAQIRLLANKAVARAEAALVREAAPDA